MRQITVAVCVDDQNGMGFGGRRQSRDRVLIADFMSDFPQRTPVFVSEYSHSLFADYPQVRVAANPLSDCEDGGICFVELQPLMPYLDEIETLILYRWNRFYPSDLKFDIPLADSGLSLQSSCQFAGSSHEKITKEVYRKC